MARIQLVNVKKSFGKVQALNGINIDVKDKLNLAIGGPLALNAMRVLGTRKAFYNSDNLE